MRIIALELLTLCAACWLAPNRAAADMVVFSEIMYHPQNPRPEYLVIENLTSTPFDIAGWELSEGVHFQFPAFSTNAPLSTFLRAHERLVVAGTSESAFRAAYALPTNIQVFGPWKGRLANEGERITLRDKNGTAMCSLKYGSGGLWPNGADGTGRSLVLKIPNGRLSDPHNWSASKDVITTVALSRPDLPPGDSGVPLSKNGDASPNVGRVPSPGTLETGTNGVIINEIMFDAPGSTGEGEYVELFNRGQSEADLSGWKFDDGIRFSFPAGTLLSPGGFLVVARNATWLRERHGGLPVVGDFQGRLRNEGEHLRLIDARGQLVNEVDFRSGGEWPAIPNSGSSLELINPAMDNRLPSAWRASDESAKAPWQTYACTNVYRELNLLGQPSDYRELHLQLAGRGHIALKNIVLLREGTNCLLNAARISTSGAGDTGWLCQGTHWASFITNGEFHLVSDGRGDDRANRAEIDVPGLEPNATYILRFEARWISGKPRLIAQSWDRSIAHSFLLETPRRLGTPGVANSQFAVSPPPQVDFLRQSPAVPRPGERVKITARIWSASPLASVELWHRPDQADARQPWRTKPMFDVGAKGGNGIYATELTEYTNRAQTVQFFVRVTAQNGQTATTPRAAPERAALFVVDDQPIPRDLRTMRLVLSARDLGAMAQGNTAPYHFSFPRQSSHYFNATVIINEQEVFYGAEVRNSGSLLTRTSELRKPKLKLPEDHSFRGRVEFVYDDDAAGGAAYHNRLTRYLLYLLGHPVNENEFVRVVVNAGSPVLREETEPVNHEFLNRNFARGSHGELYHIAEDWSLLDDWDGIFKDADWTCENPDTPSAWRNSWPKRSRGTEDDYSNLIALFKQLGQTNAAPQELERLLDTRTALKLTAVRGYVGDWDTFTMQRGRNSFLYRRPGDGKFQFLHWDGDEGFVGGQPFYGQRVKQWVEQPQNLRVLYYYLLELVRLCSQEPERVRTWLQVEKQTVGDSVFQATYLNFFAQREKEVLQAMEGKDRLPFQARLEPASPSEETSPPPTQDPELVVPASAGNPPSKEQGPARTQALVVPASAGPSRPKEQAPPPILSGQAPYGILHLIIEGHPEARVEWTSDIHWKASQIKLAPAETALLIQGVNEQGKPLAQSKISLPAQSTPRSPQASLRPPLTRESAAVSGR